MKTVKISFCLQKKAKGITADNELIFKGEQTSPVRSDGNPSYTLAKVEEVEIVIPVKVFQQAVKTAFPYGMEG